MYVRDRRNVFSRINETHKYKGKFSAKRMNSPMNYFRKQSLHNKTPRVLERSIEKDIAEESGVGAE